MVSYVNTLLIIASISSGCIALQEWSQQPRYQEVNPHGSVVMPCVISNKKGECRWERDGNPVGMYPTKYEWAGSPEKGDCSIRILDANLEYDDGVWQCQVTPSSFQSKDSLISEGAELVVREAPKSILIQRVGDAGKDIIAAAGEDLELECIAQGSNPPSKLTWFASGKEIPNGHIQEDEKDSKGTYTSFSRLTLPVSKEDNRAEIKCKATHPALENPITAVKPLTIHYPPSVKVETSSLENLEDEKDSVTLRCVVDSNPPAAILWRKEGLNGIFSPEQEIVFSPVTRHTAGLYSCSAENQLGMSKPDYVELDVKYSPRILSVGPQKIMAAQMYNITKLTCEAEGNPPPKYTWLQKLPTQGEEVLIRGYEQELTIKNVTYDYQGEFVCQAMNEINGEKRTVQSEPIQLKVSGPPQVLRYKVKEAVVVPIGADAALQVEFCANPMSNQSWHLGDKNGNKVILASGTGHGRFVAETLKKSPNNKTDCYISTLRINGAHPTDSHTYQLRLSNQHGVDTHTIKLAVKDKISQESLIAVVVGTVATIAVLMLILVIIYMCKADKCCCTSTSNHGHHKKDCKNADLESDKTDLESTHSSNASSGIDKSHQVIPPDALYSMKNSNAGYISYEAMFNDSKESLRPDLVSLNRSSGEFPLPPPPGISYNDLCFPKTSNYGSMKKKKNKHFLANGTANVAIPRRHIYVHE